MQVIRHFNILLAEAGAIYEAVYFYSYLEHLVPLPILDILHLSLLVATSGLYFIIRESSWLMHVDFWPREEHIYL